MSTPGHSRARMTADAYLAMADDGRRCQLFDGGFAEITPGPSAWHQLIGVQLAAWLHGHARTHRLGTIIPSPVDVLFGPRTVARPDLLCISTARAAALDPDRVRIAPDLSVEIRSPRRLGEDLGCKADVYAAAGIAHDGLVDLEARFDRGVDARGRAPRRALPRGGRRTDPARALPGTRARHAFRT